MVLTDEQQALLDGSGGEVMAKVVKTLVMYGETFGAGRMAPVTSAYGHTVISFGLGAMKPIYDLYDTLLSGGMVLYAACAMGRQPACMLFSRHIDSLAASGAILGDVWTDVSMPVVDQLGDAFLEQVQTGMKITVAEDGAVTVE